jgi:prepilin-type N-terminal cleavage/methylation domain-containing protein
MKKVRAFTLIEVMICIILTCIVVFFIYTMMLSSHATFVKLLSVSTQRNDLRYFETMIKRSIINADFIDINIAKKTMKFGYYDPSGMFSEGYRADVYYFKNDSHILSKNITRSKTLSGLTLGEGNEETKYYDDLYLKIYKTQDDTYDTEHNATVLRDEEIVLEKVNKLYYNIDKNADQHTVFDFSLIFFRELRAVKQKFREKNYEGQEYSFTVKNDNFKNG